MNKKLPYSKKRTFKNKEKKLEKKHYAILIVLMLTFVFLNIFDNTIVIGEDFRFSILTIILPLTVGTIVLIFYRKEFLVIKFSNEKNKLVKGFMIVFYLTEALLVSFLALAYPSQFILTQINKKISSNSSPEIIVCKVANFFEDRRGSSINFKYNNNLERIKVSHKEMKIYINKNPDNFILELTVKKGIWNTYVVQKFEIHTK